MSNPDLSRSAEEHLRTIRSLMERATIYRAISTGPALVAGLLGTGLGIWQMRGAESLSSRGFLLWWLGAMAVVGAVNTWVLLREARGRGMPFPSPATRQGMRTLLPPMLACGVSGAVLCGWSGEPVTGALLWVLGYGLGLVATSGFAPRSIKALGWAFVVAGVAGFFWRELRGIEPGDAAEAARIMAVTFGGFHLVYAVRTGWWKRSGQSE